MRPGARAGRTTPHTAVVDRIFFFPFFFFFSPPPPLFFFFFFFFFFKKKKKKKKKKHIARAGCDCQGRPIQAGSAENINIFDFELTEQEMGKIGTLDRGEWVVTDSDEFRSLNSEVMSGTRLERWL